jgi:cytochrome c oxidase cbb3-type subunit 4
MDITTLRILVTVIRFGVFIGIIWWTFSGKRDEDFAKAAQLPFEQD